MKKNQKGSVLGGVLVVFVTVFILGTALLQLTTASHRQSLNTVDKKQATYMAESGLDILAKYVQNNPGDACDILPTNTKTVIKSRPIILKDASDGEWNVTVDIESVAGEEDTYKITSKATGTNTKSDIEEKVSAIIKGNKTQTAILGGSAAHNINIDNSIVEIVNGSVICRDSITMWGKKEPPAVIELENLVTLGNYEFGHSATRLKVDKAYIGGNAEIINSMGLDINEIEVGKGLTIKGTTLMDQYTGIDNVINIGKLFTTGETSITGITSNEGSIKIGELVSIGKVELGRKGNGNGNGNENGVPVKAGKIFSGENITLYTDEKVITEQEIKEITMVGENKLDTNDYNKDTVGSTIIIPTEQYKEDMVRDKSWVSAIGRGGNLVEHTFRDDTKIDMPEWVSHIFAQADRSADALELLVMNSNLPLLSQGNNGVVFNFNKVVDKNEKYVNGDDIPTNKLIKDLWVEEKGELYVNESGIHIMLENAKIPEGEFLPINIYNPEGTVEIKNCSGRMVGQIVAKEINIKNSSNNNNSNNDKDKPLILDLGGGTNNTDSQYTSFKIIKYEK
ncbi:MAG: pilus assembly PilX N-terminal domain-containing protein [Cellulosilyticaceae bacterium]